VGTKTPVCSILYHLPKWGPFFPNSTHSSPQLDSGAHSPRQAWPFHTRHLVNPNQKLDLPFLLSHREYSFLLLIGDHIRLEFYGTQLTISATIMDARRFSLLPFHASRSRAQSSPSRHHANKFLRAIPGVRKCFERASPSIDHDGME
jgi:hypothetical protein